jgi:hypothetical protein
MVTICTTSFHILKPCILYTEYIYAFLVILTINSDYFLQHHYPVGLCTSDVMRLL